MILTQHTEHSRRHCVTESPRSGLYFGSPVVGTSMGELYQGCMTAQLSAVMWRDVSCLLRASTEEVQHLHELAGMRLWAS